MPPCIPSLIRGTGAMARVRGPCRHPSCTPLLSALSVQSVSFQETKVHHLPTCCPAPAFPAIQSPSPCPKQKARSTALGRSAGQEAREHPSGKPGVLEVSLQTPLSSFFPSSRWPSSLFLTFYIGSPLSTPTARHFEKKHL